MRNLIVKALVLVLLWAFTGPAAMVAASGQGAHECCYRSHHLKSAHVKPTNDLQFQSQGPSHECCRLIFASQSPTVTTASLTITPHAASTIPAGSTQQRCPELRTSAHPGRAPPFAPV